MSLKIVFIASVIALSEASFAQGKLTTVILLRHAEKISDGSKDPGLTETGKKKAESLVSLFKNTSLSAIYSTDFIRTRETVAPLAKSKSLAIKNYEALKTDVIDNMLKEHEGKTILICGHSNNIPSIANYLRGTEEFKTFADNEYDNILIVTVGKERAATVTWLTF